MKSATLAAGILAGSLAHAGAIHDQDYNWSRVLVPETPPAIEIREVSRPELRRVIRENARGITAGGYRRFEGFAALFRDRETGDYRCVIWTLDEDNQAILEHERLHCEGWTHD